MFNDYRYFDNLLLPQEIRELLIRLKNGGMISPVIYGGSIRDSITNYKKIHDYDIRCAGIDEPSIQKSIKDLLDKAPTETALIETPVPEQIKNYFIKKMGIRLTEGVLIEDSVKLLGDFVNNSGNIPPIDICITRRSYAATTPRIRREVFDTATAALNSASAGPDGCIYAHRYFEKDAQYNIFRPNPKAPRFGLYTYQNYLTLKKTLPDLKFKHNLFTGLRIHSEELFPKLFYSLRFCYRAVKKVIRKKK